MYGLSNIFLGIQVMRGIHANTREIASPYLLVWGNFDASLFLSIPNKNKRLLILKTASGQDKWL